MTLAAVDEQNRIDAMPIMTAYPWARWIKLKPAARYSSLGEHRLKDLARQGIIIGYPDPESKRGDWIFDKESIDKYRLRQAGSAVNIEEKLLALKAKIRL